MFSGLQTSTFNTIAASCSVMREKHLWRSNTEISDRIHCTEIRSSPCETIGQARNQ